MWTLPYLELRPGSPSVTIQKLTACDCWCPGNSGKICFECVNFYSNMVSHTHTTTTSTIIPLAALSVVLIRVIPSFWYQGDSYLSHLHLFQFIFLDQEYCYGILLLKKFCVCNFRGYWQLWKFFNSENFPIYGRFVEACYTHERQSVHHLEKGSPDAIQC